VSYRVYTPSQAATRESRRDIYSLSRAYSLKRRLSGRSHLVAPMAAGRARLAATTGNDPDGAAVADGARAVTIPHLDNRAPGPWVPRLCCAHRPIALPALCGFRDPSADPLDGSRGRGARLGACRGVLRPNLENRVGLWRGQSPANRRRRW